MIDPGTALHLLYKLGEPAPALEMYEDPDSHSYIAGIDVANMPNERVYGIKNGDARTYTYYSNLVKVFENGKTYWMCPSDTHIHGFYRYFISYDGNELSITHSEGPYYAE